MTTLSSKRNDDASVKAPHADNAIEVPNGNYPPLYIVLNAGSGRKNAAAVKNELARFLDEAKLQHTIFLCRHPRDLSAMADRAVEEASNHHGIVVASGGDGTIRTVAQRVLSAGLPFGVVPQGTFNYFARDNGLPQDLAGAAAALIAGIQSGTERLVQAGQINDQVFLVNASIGLYPQLLEDRETYKQRYGRSRMVAKWAGLLTLLRRNTEMLLRLEYTDPLQKSEADVIRACTLFAGNNSLQLDQVGLPDGQDAPDGQLVVLVLPPMNVMERLAIAVRGMFGQLSSSPNAAHFLCRHLTVEPLARAMRRHVKVAMDGESTWMHPPLVFRVAPRPLRLIVPPAPRSEA